MALAACPECDLLLNPHQAEVGEKAHCPRCGYLLHRPSKNSIERTLALSMAGLLLMLPATILPLLDVTVLSNSNDGTLWGGAFTLFAEGMWAVAILVFFSSILFPLLNIVLSLLISFHLYFNKPNKYLPHWMRWLQHLKEWAMLEVYMLGIIIASVKVASMAELKIGLGLYAFIALILVTGMLTSSLDQYLFWRHIRRLNNKTHEN
jgi:paraquat-inducible protein A